MQRGVRASDANASCHVGVPARLFATVRFYFAAAVGTRTRWHSQVATNVHCRAPIAPDIPCALVAARYFAMPLF